MLLPAIVASCCIGPPQPPAPAPALTLQYDAPPMCPDAEAVRQMVRESLSTVPGDDQRHVVHAVATLSEDDPNLFRLEITIESDGQPRHRSLTDPSCEVLTRTGATLIAIAVDPRLAAVLADEAPESDATIPELPEALTPSPAPANPDFEPTLPQGPASQATDDFAPTMPSGPPPVPRWTRPRPRWTLSLGGGLSINVLPGAAGLATAGVDVSGRWWRASAGLRTQPAKRGGTREVTGRFSTVAGVLEGCGVPAAGVLEFPLCLGIASGGMRGRAIDAAESNVGWFAWLSVHAGPAVRWRAHPRIHPWLAAEVVVPVLRGRFVVDGAREPVFEPGRIGAAARVGLAFVLGNMKSDSP